MTVVLGWDIGGVNTKVAALKIEQGRVVSQSIETAYYEVWRDRAALVGVLCDLARRCPSGDVWAITMTAELSDAFQTKREGVEFILDAVDLAAGRAGVAVFAVDGAFLTSGDARQQPLRVAAANWAAMAQVVAEDFANALLVDCGSTTTDVIPIVDQRVAAVGWTDPDRLTSGELVYTGALRTPISAVVQAVPLRGQWCRVSPEYFAIMADVHLMLGHISADDYRCPTPDHRGRTSEDAAARLARAVCADAEMLSSAELRRLAAFVASRQVSQIEESLRQVLSRIEVISAKAGRINTEWQVVAVGAGRFLAQAAAARAGLPSIGLGERFGAAADTVAPSVAVARLWAQSAGIL